MDVMEEIKTCTKCRKTKALAEFPVYRSSLRRSACQECVRAYNREAQRRWTARNPELARQRHRDWYEKNREHALEYARNVSNPKKYGLTKDQIKVKIESQQGTCAVCDKPLNKTAVDHDRSCCPREGSCGKCVRSILCPTCNTGLGMFKDDPDLLLAAAMYVLRWKERHEAVT